MAFCIGDLLRKCGTTLWQRSLLFTSAGKVILADQCKAESSELDSLCCAAYICSHIFISIKANKANQYSKRIV